MKKNAYVKQRQGCDIMVDLTVLTRPLTIKGVTLANRYASAPLDLQQASETGLVTDELLDLYRRRRGPGLIIVEHSYVHPAGRWSTCQLAVDRDECLAGLKRLAELLHGRGQIAIMQISHAGGCADPNITGLEPVAPSAVLHPVRAVTEPHALTLKEIERVKEAFVTAALRVQEAGFDGVEIHGAHGYLLCQFLSPLTNKRTDKYGGNLENRARLHTEIVQLVRQMVEKDFLIFFRLGCDDFMAGGTTVDDAAWLAPRLAADGVDVLDVTSGMMGSTAFSGDGFFRPMLKIMKDSVAIPVIGVGGLEKPDVAAAVIANGEADIVALGRAIVREPAVVERILRNI